MKPINFNLLFGLFFGILAVGCSDKNEIPVDADDNFITSVVLSVNDKTYDAVIENNTITVNICSSHPKFLHPFFNIFWMDRDTLSK